MVNDVKSAYYNGRPSTTLTKEDKSVCNNCKSSNIVFSYIPVILTFIIYNLD